MLFMSDKPEKTGPKVEGKLRKEIKAASPVPYTAMLQGKYVPGSVGQAAGDLLDSVMADLWIGGTRPLHTLRFDVAAPRPFELNVQIIKGQAVCVGGLLYSAVIDRPTNGAVRLGGEGFFGKAKLEGDEATASKLNASKPVLKALNFLARDRYVLGQTEIISKRYATLTPLKNGKSLLTVSTMPRSKFLNLSSSFDASAFVELANLVEVALA